MLPVCKNYIMKQNTPDIEQILPEEETRTDRDIERENIGYGNAEERMDEIEDDDTDLDDEDDEEA